LEPFAEEEANEDDNQAIDRELERVQQQLQTKKDRFTNQLEEKEGLQKS
jgi:restriction endonuclease S subunit